MQCVLSQPKVSLLGFCHPADADALKKQGQKIGVTGLNKYISDADAFKKQ